jgi:hypothetical protein
MLIQKYRSIEVKKEQIKPNVPENLTLSDNVVCFNLKGEWIIIPIALLVKYPIIYFFNEETQETHSIVSCLLTLRVMYVYEKVRWERYDGLHAIFTNEAGDLLSFETKLGKDGEKIVDFKRSQTKIETLRSALIEYGDLRYLHLDIPENKTNLIQMSYYSDFIDYEGKDLEKEVDLEKRVHPKTLCLMISYHSEKGKNGVKNTIVFAKNKLNKISGYEPKKEGLDRYLAMSTEKLIEKNAFILNILHYTAKILYPDAKFIEL